MSTGSVSMGSVTQGDKGKQHPLSEDPSCLSGWSSHLGKDQRRGDGRTLGAAFYPVSRRRNMRSVLHAGLEGENADLPT